MLDAFLAPVAVLSNEGFFHAIWRFPHRIGSAHRQPGILAGRAGICLEFGDDTGSLEFVWGD